MKKQLLFLALLVAPFLLSAQAGKVFDSLTMKSEILKMEKKYSIYLPPDYETSGRKYPVLYLLHGAGDDQSGWVFKGEVFRIANKAINEELATSMIIVMPDASEGRRGYFNDDLGEWRYEDFFFDEFIPYIEKTYRIRDEKRCRAIAGLSMGGGGTFFYALRHPEMFVAACPMSANCGPVSIDDVGFRRRRSDQNNDRPEMTQAEKEENYKRRSVVYAMENMPEEQKDAIKWYIDCGDEDQFSKSNALVHVAMLENEIPHEYRVRNGGHNWTYWRSSLPDIMEFISAYFHR